MIDTLIDFGIGYYPHIGVGLTVLAGGLAILRKVSKKTKTTIDDKIVKKADETGVSKLLARFNPFKK